MKNKSRVSIFIFIALVIAVIFTIAGCSSPTENTGSAGKLNSVTDSAVGEQDEGLTAVQEDEDADGESTVDEKEKSDFDADAVIAQLKVTEYDYKTDYRNGHVMVIKNDTEYDLDISANVTAFNKNGDMIGAKSAREYIVEKGTEVALTISFDDTYKKTEYQLSVSESDYVGVASKIKYKGSQLKDKIVLAVTNTGDSAAQFVEGTALFFKGKKLVYMGTSYFRDNDNVLLPNATINGEIRCYEKYDKVDVYFTARAAS